MTPGAESRQSPWRRRIAPCAGTLILVPLVVLFLGSDLTLDRPLAIDRVLLHDGTGSSPVTLRLRAAGVHRREAQPLPQGAYLELTPSRPVQSFRLALQAGSGDRFLVTASVDGEQFDDIWVVARGPNRRGLQMRGPVLFSLPAPIQVLRVHPRGDDAPTSVSAVVLDEVWRVHPAFVVPPVLWLAWWGLSLAARSRLGWVPARLLATWERHDTAVAIVLSYIVLFRVLPVVAAFTLVVVVLAGLVRWLVTGLHADPLRAGLRIAGTLLVGLMALRVGTEIVVRTLVGRVHDLTVDHRLRPDGDEINEDGLRFRGTAADLGERDFVVLFLGDSFTQGVFLDYEEAYPYVVEETVATGSCSVPVRVVNLGWVSSSPLLSLRLLRDIGQKYRPDLLVYSLDMTDFHDDLRYENALRAGRDFEPDTSTALLTLGRTVGFDTAVGQAALELFRGLNQEIPSVGLTVPRNRFFVTSRSLEQSRGAIERGVMRNLAALHRYGQDVLDAPLALVVYPRSYQYSARESPQNWERREYEILGPYVEEPFRYFEEVGDALPYPVFSLLPAFTETEEYPLFFRQDPHWNADGARLAGEHVARWLSARSLIPCSPPGTMTRDVAR